MTNLASAESATHFDVTRHLPALQAALEEQRRFRSEQLDELAEAARACPPLAIDEPRDQTAEAITTGAHVALSEIHAALDRLDHGNYGRCETCKGPIPLERLEILPMAPLCMRCQHAQESRRH